MTELINSPVFWLALMALVVALIQLIQVHRLEAEMKRDATRLNRAYRRLDAINKYHAPDGVHSPIGNGEPPKYPPQSAAATVPRLKE